MRVTAEQKATTRQRILDESAALFRRQGFEATTTRDIARAAKIAAGTLFNYFPTKEAIVGALVAAGVARARDAALTTTAGSLEEELFAAIAVELRQLKGHRKYLGPLLETSLSPLASPTRDDACSGLRSAHLEAVAERARRHGLGELSPLALQLYWTLYTGVLAFWAADKSPKQEDTLALLDQALAMYVGWLRTEVEHAE